MRLDEFTTAVSLLTKKAPPGWTEIQARYQYYDGAMKVNTYFKDTLSKDWLNFNYYDFDLMDFFDEYRVVDYGRTDKEWTALTLTVNNRHEIDVEYGYDIPNILNPPVN